MAGVMSLFLQLSIRYLQGPDYKPFGGIDVPSAKLLKYFKLAFDENDLLTDEYIEAKLVDNEIEERAYMLFTDNENAVFEHDYFYDNSQKNIILLVPSFNIDAKYILSEKCISRIYNCCKSLFDLRDGISTPMKIETTKRNYAAALVTFVFLHRLYDISIVKEACNNIVPDDYLKSMLLAVGSDFIESGIDIKNANAVLQYYYDMIVFNGFIKE